jgi:lysophospholipase L1-like esterase
MRVRLATTLFACSLVIAIDVPGASAAPIKVACVGDSITQLSGWPAMLGTMLGAGYTATNYGLAGTTLLKSGDNPYWNTQQFKDSHAANPDVVVIMLGTNDSKAFNWTTHSGEFVGDYEALVDTYAALPSHPRMYLSLCPPAGTNGYNIVGSVIENEIIPDIKQVAAAKGLPTIDVFDAFGGHNLDPSLYGGPGDLVHPNAKGAQVIATTVYAGLTASASDGGAGAVSDGGVQGDASVDVVALGGAAGAAGGADGAAGAAGSGAASGASGSASGASGATATGGATASGGSGGPATGGAAGAGAKPPHASSGGCALAARSGDLAGLGLCVACLAWLGARRSSRRRRAQLS